MYIEEEERKEKRKKKEREKEDEATRTCIFRHMVNVFIGKVKPLKLYMRELNKILVSCASGIFIRK